MILRDNGLQILTTHKFQDQSSIFLVVYTTGNILYGNLYLENLIHFLDDSLMTGDYNHYHLLPWFLNIK